MADELQVELEEVVADGIEFIEFEGDHAYCQYNKCETESKELVWYLLTYLQSLHRIYISAYFCCMFRVHTVRSFFKMRRKTGIPSYSAVT